MRMEMNRRTFLGGLAVAGLPARSAAPAAPTAPVAIAKCKTYAEYLPVMEKMIDQVGGLGRLVKGKTVVIKINFTGGPNTRLGFLSQSRTYWTHPHRGRHDPLAQQGRRPAHTRVRRRRHAAGCG